MSDTKAMFRMTSSQANSVSEFLSTIQIESNQSKQFLFRGQPCKRELLPAIARANPMKDTTAEEKEILREFERRSLPYQSTSQQSELDLLVNAQHHGLKTRLLDWTANPLIAIWFACIQNANKVGYVYKLDASRHLASKSQQHSPFNTSKTSVLKPRHTNNRIVAQDGWFTLHKFSKSSKKFVPLERNPGIRESIAEIEILNTDSILAQLDQLGINSHSVFPDLEGLSRHLNWLHKLD